MNLCRCGCNQYCKDNYIRGHNSRGIKQSKDWIDKRQQKVVGQKRPKLSEKRKGKGNPMFGKHSWNYNLNKETDIRVFNNCLNPKRIEKIRNSIKNQHKEGKRARAYEGIRKSVLKRAKDVGGPFIGRKEKEILDELEKTLGFKIIRQYNILGYALDGYITELNLAIEVDGEEHYNSDGTLKIKDKKREIEIKSKINCEFLRIRVLETQTYCILYCDAHFFIPNTKNNEERFIVLQELKKLQGMNNVILIIHDFWNGKFSGITYDGQSLNFDLLKEDLLRVNPNFKFYTNTECDVFQLGTLPKIIRNDPDARDNLKYAWSSIEKRDRGILYCVPKGLDLKKYKLREIKHEKENR